MVEGKENPSIKISIPPVTDKLFAGGFNGKPEIVAEYPLHLDQPFVNDGGDSVDSPDEDSDIPQDRRDKTAGPLSFSQVYLEETSA